MKLMLILSVFSVMFAACSPTQQANESKLDAPLKIKLNELRGESSAKPVQLIGKCVNDISGEQLIELKRACNNIYPAGGRIFTAEATADEIIKLSNIEYVLNLQLSQENYSK